MTAVVSFSPDIQISTSPPREIAVTDTWLAIPPVYEIPFNYQGDSSGLRNYGRDVWVRIPTEDINSVSIDSGNATILFNPGTGILSTSMPTGMNIVVVQGILTTTILDGRTTALLILPSSDIYSVDPAKSQVPENVIIPVIATSPTGITQPSGEIVTPRTELMFNSPTPAMPRPSPTPAMPRPSPTPMLFSPMYNSAQLFNAAGQEFRNLFQGQLGSLIRDGNTNWRSFW